MIASCCNCSTCVHVGICKYKEHAELIKDQIMESTNKILKKFEWDGVEAINQLNVNLQITCKHYSLCSTLEKESYDQLRYL